MGFIVDVLACVPSTLVTPSIILYTPPPIDRTFLSRRFPDARFMLYRAQVSVACEGETPIEP